MPQTLMFYHHWSMMSQQSTGAQKVVEEVLLQTLMEPSTITTTELVTLRTIVSVRTSQVKVNQDMLVVPVNRFSVILNVEMENV